MVDKGSRKRGIAKSQLTNNKQVTQYNIQGKKVKLTEVLQLLLKEQGLAISMLVAGQRVMNIQQVDLFGVLVKILKLTLSQF